MFSIEKIIIVGVDLGAENFRESMNELRQLVLAAGGEVVGELTQKREAIKSSTYLGKGKIEELSLMVDELEADTVVFNNELFGSQIRNIEAEVDRKIIDRTYLILDIFAKRATSKEGQLQVQLAKLMYRLPRLAGFYSALSKVAGGIGTRGLGEQQLELDRRVINKEIQKVKNKLKQVERTRDNTRLNRKRANLPLVSLVGYTNSGKSTILNKLVKEDKQVFAKDMLFATLDTAHRRVNLPNGQPVIMSDTVGFVSDLPTLLVESFKSTLAEVKQADMIVVVIDGSSPDYQMQLDTTLLVLKELDCLDKPMLIVFNKMDLLIGQKPLAFHEKKATQIHVSALEDAGIDLILSGIEEILSDWFEGVSLLVPYDQYSVVDFLNNKYHLVDVEYLEAGVRFNCIMQRSDITRIQNYLIDVRMDG